MSDPAAGGSSDGGAAASRDDRGGSGFALFLVLAAAVAAFLVADLRTRAPAPGPAGADGEGLPYPADVPRPVGSAAHDAERDRILTRFREMGYEPVVESGWAVSVGHRTAARVENVVATLPGSEPGPTVHLVSHYDSVPAGPGASDAGMGVAVVLDVARELRERGKVPRHGVTFLLTDAEEGGMLGARAYLAEHGPDGIRAVVNLEARGTTGPALLFETGPGSAWTVGAWGRAAHRPITGSVFASVYRTLPNDTDLSVFRRAGVPGLNFACIGAVQHYHTPLDSRANADPATAAHLRANAFAAVVALAEADGARPDTPGAESGEAHWCDVLGFGVLSWPEDLTPTLALVAAAALVLGAIVRVARGRLALFGWLAGTLVAAIGAALAFAAVLGAGAALAALGAFPRQFPASSDGALLAAAGAAAAGAALPAWLAARRLPAVALHSGAWTFLALVAATFATGALERTGAIESEAVGALRDGAYLFVLPACAVALVTVVGAFGPRWMHRVEALVGVSALGALWFPMAFLLADALGVGPIPGVGLPLVAAGAPFAVVATAVVPALGGAARGWLVPAASVLLTLVGGAVQASAPTETPELPQPLSIVHRQDEGAHDADWMLWPSAWGVPEEMREGREWDGARAFVVPWRNDRVVGTHAPALPLLAPELRDVTVRSVDGGRRIAFRMASRRGAPVTALSVAPSTRLRRILVEGISIPPEALRDESNEAFTIHVLTTPFDGVSIELDAAQPGPVEVLVSDTTWGLPAEAGDLLRSRPARCVPMHWGDHTVVRRKARL